MSTLQRTRLSQLQAQLGRSVAAGLGGPWWQRSLSIIALLSGFLIGNYLTVHLSAGLGFRTHSALISLILAISLEIILKLASFHSNSLKIGKIVIHSSRKR